MDKRRTDPARRRRIERIAGQLRDAIERERFLVRLPGEAELARIARCSVREAREALAALAAEGWVRRGPRGHRVVRRPRSGPGLRSVVLVQYGARPVATFGDWLAYGADERCRQLGLGFQNHWVDHGATDESLERLGGEMPGPSVGWIVTFATSKRLVEDWVARGRRVVLADCETPLAGVPRVLLNLAEAIDLALAHLAARRHRRVAWFMRSNYAVLRMRAERGLLIRGPWNAEVSYAHELLPAATDWLKRWRAASRSERPTAVIAYNAELARHFLAVAAILGVEIPDQLSVVALGGLLEREPGPATGPAVTHASSGRAAELGASAVRLLTRPDFPGPADAATVMLPAVLLDPEATVARLGR